LFEAIAENGDAVVGAVGEGGAGDLAGLAEADDAGDVFGAGAALALVGSAEEEGLEAGAAAGVEDADALGRVELVSGDAEQMAADGLDVDGDLSGSLHRVGVEGDLGFGGDFSDGFDGLDDAGFVVGHHDADELCVGLEGAVNIEGIDDAGGGNGKEGDVDAAVPGLVGGVEDGVVLDSGGNEVVTGSEDAEECGIIALRAAGGEDDLSGAAVEERGNLFAGALDRGAGVLAVLVDGGGVAEGVNKEGPHGLQHLGEERGGGIGVHVNAAHTFILAAVAALESVQGSKTAAALRLEERGAGWRTRALLGNSASADEFAAVYSIRAVLPRRKRAQETHAMNALRLGRSLVCAALISAPLLASAQDTLLNASEASKLVPDSVYFAGKLLKTHPSESASIHYKASGHYVLAFLLDTGGEPNAVTCYLLTEVPLGFNGNVVAPGAYGIYLAHSDHNSFVVVTNIGNDRVFNGGAPSSTYEMPHPLPLQILEGDSPERYRLCFWQNCVAFTRQ